MWFLLLTLAAYRLVRLWMFDVIAEPIRGRVIGGYTRTGWLLQRPNRFKLWLYELLTCPWCLGVWVSFALTITLAVCGMEPYRWTPLGVALLVVTALACSAVQAFWHLLENLVEALQERLDPDEDE